MALPRPRLRLAVGIFALLAALACGPDPSTREGEPLFGRGAVPEILLEASRLELPTAPSANRFLNGWWPWTSEGGLALGASPQGARLQIVHLEPRPRELILDLVDPPPGEPLGKAALRVLAAGRQIGELPLTDPLRIALPADLPGGKITVELLPVEPSGAPVDVLRAAVQPALPAGEVRFEEDRLAQGGYSEVEIVGEVGPGAELVGTFLPPQSPRPGQEFSLTLERTDAAHPGETSRFAWSSGGRSLASLLARGHPIRLAAGGTRGLVRVRLTARGEGPAGRWVGLRWVGRPSLTPGSAPAAATSTPSSTPRGTPEDPGLPRLVVLYVMDALRADHLGHLGGPEGISPTLDRLAAEGLTFLHHRSVAPNTLPSTKALFTGEIYADRGGWQLPPDGRPTLAEELRRAGYRTGLFSGNGYVSPAYGMDRGFELVSEDTYFDEHPGASRARSADPAFNDNAARVHRAALEWVESLPSWEPVFLYLHTIHPHNPYDPPQPLRSRFAPTEPASLDGSTGTLLGVQHGRIEVGAAGERKLRGLYAGGVAYNDAELAKLLAALGRRYAPEETLWIVTSDHGEELFDHGGVLHGYTLYEEMIHIPLVVWSPERVGRGTVEAPTSTVDLHATLIDLLGRGGQVPSEGRSLLGLWRSGREPDREPCHLAAAASVEGGIFSLQRGRWKLVWAPRTGTAWGMGEGRGRSRDAEYLFDLEADPQERHNRLGDGDPQEDWLRATLRAWVAAKTAHREEGAPGTEPRPDDETRERLRALGYVD